MTVYVQIGAGAGDKDSRVNFRDGFTELVKKTDKSTISRIILVEPNPLNIPSLVECWKDYPQAEIYNIAICSTEHKIRGVYLFYTEKDAPHYQVSSVFPDQIKRIYGADVDLKKILVGCMNINEFNSLVLAEDEYVVLYSIDVEGMDSEIIFDLDFSKIFCEYFSFEHLSLGNKQKEVLAKLRKDGFVFDGYGIDIHGYDWLFRHGSFWR